MNTDDLRRQYKGVAYPPLVAAICFFDSEGFEDDANQAAEKYASYQAIATAAREVIDGQPLGDTAPDDFIANFRIRLGAIRQLAAALAALEQETK